ncbi:predicted protein [Nematostella vectensis]|uniref:AntA/AntB antirepressor domain-containing protein n=1 Tax=Nematostella vectensis TaxID=45351 RepID=A8DWT1_NEMVE|nr:predicted protein [Nematostella vectensis]|eukprot:XP_001617429.1 hypothetical protein NEMVEDRAFT_v1g226088 [Nematostella vectensis]
MTNVISITTALPITTTAISNENTQTVDARRLHEWLGSGKMFAHWIKQRIKLYGFVEGEDYLPVLARKNERGQPRQEYNITIDMAKHLAMMERNKQGHAARKYFIEMEKQAKGMFADMQVMATMSQGDMHRMLAARADEMDAARAALDLEKEVAAVTRAHFAQNSNPS